jgi:hypothetical protein
MPCRAALCAVRRKGEAGIGRERHGLEGEVEMAVEHKATTLLAHVDAYRNPVLVGSPSPTSASDVGVVHCHETSATRHFAARS